MRWWAMDYLVLSPEYLPDLKTADAENVSFLQNLSDALHMEASAGIIYHSPDRMIQTIKKGLNSHLAQITPLLAEEADFALMFEIGEDSNGWKEFNATKLLFGATYRIACRFFIAKELSGDEKLIKTLTAFTESIFINGLIIKMLPLGPIRGILAWPISFFHRRKMEAALERLQPLVERRISLFAADDSSSMKKSPNTEHFLDAIDWILTASSAQPTQQDSRILAIEILHNFWASSGSPSALLTQIVFQVLMFPMYLDPLRKEVQDAVSKYGWTEKAVQSLPLLDSFIRETNRLYPSFSVKGEPWRLHDGLVLPVGTRCIWAADPLLRNPKAFVDPLVFDGFRFARLATDDEKREGKEDGNSSAASFLSPTNLAFGYGRHACPGRFYALRKVKVLFGKLILGYDIEWDTPRTERPSPVSVEAQFAPNLWQKIRLRRRPVPTEG
ncbi:hypothetical protein G7Y89_g3058 [Cudoniella acicularis]|uniref:Cytochrome P450 n=1 Tax=Cudoniella acicularis TaxID=354080 RepID=A0A8H4RTB0_9HELO|nr:hypothetical protein G7Y89_g3058 [Cudoniella acicularis]